jgi:hypothetical protein
MAEEPNQQSGRPTSPSAPIDLALDQVGLAPEEKAKMDYQAVLEKKKMKDAFRLSLYGLALDKGCLSLVIGVVVCLVVFSTNCGMERYKLQESHRRFLMEKRLDALVSVSGAVSEMTGLFFRYCDPKNNVAADKADAEYSAAIERARDAVNRHLPILGNEFDKDLSRYIQIHRSFQLIGVKKCGSYRDWASELDSDFTHLCRVYLESDTFPAEKRMKLKPITYEERIRMTAQEYVDAQFGYWKAVKR